MYSYQCGLQSIENRANVQTKGSGFDQYVDFNIRLSKNSSQPSNQGYVKLLQGMMSMADFIGKFSEGTNAVMFAKSKNLRLFRKAQKAVFMKTHSYSAIPRPEPTWCPFCVLWFYLEKAV